MTATKRAPIVGPAAGSALGTVLTRLRGRGIDAKSNLPTDLMVASVQIDSRKVHPGDVFVAVAGKRADGLAYARDAVRAGAVAVVRRSGDDDVSRDVPTIFVPDPATAAGHLAAILAGDPDDSIALVGVTGTNGKTSCTYLLESVWRAAGIPCGVGGTIEQRGPGFARPAHLTTPDAVALQEFLAELRDAGARFAALEVSSHALSQQRVAGCRFRAAIFTNLTRDHLDYHADEESYFAAKLSLFTHHLRSPDGVAVVNAEDPRAALIRSAAAPRRVVTFSADSATPADVLVIRSADASGALRGSIRFAGGEAPFTSRLFGDVNLSNIAAVAAAAIALEMDPHVVAAGIAACTPVPGRFERIGGGDAVVFVDYAHTPDALERTLVAARHICRGRLVAVFGCGGDRDRGKRPVMGEIAARIADVAVLTSDNPRSEDPLAILAEIETGVGEMLGRSDLASLTGDPGARGYVVEPDREHAIRSAITLARGGDVVVIAGKGHEDYQEISGVRRPFDDRRLVRRILEGT